VKKLVVATANQGKIREVIAMLEGLPFEVESLASYPGAPVVEETGTTFAENACLKAVAYAQYTGQLVLADDSGLEVDALDGAPGVFSSRFAPDDKSRNSKLLGMMQDVPEAQRTARFRCAIALCEPNEAPVTVDGTIEGVIFHENRGSNGFGYDPVMYIPELGKTMAELSQEQKNNISHRGQALRKAIKLLEKMP
jgi:XTP/dITP diphosphohydrolase